MKRLFRSCLFWVLLTPLLLFAGYRGCAVWLETRHEYQPLAVLDGFTVVPILDPSNFPPLEGIDPGTFDVAPDGSFVFKQGARLVVCDPSGDEPGLSVLVEQEGLDAFAFDAGGGLFTITGGVLGMYMPDAADEPAATKTTKKVSFEVGGHPRIRLLSHAEAAVATQFRPVNPGGGKSGSTRPVTGGGSYGGSGGGSSSSGWTSGEWRISELFYKPPDERVSEVAVGAPPPPGAGGVRTFVVAFPPERKLPTPSPQPVEETFMLPSTAMRLARTSRAGELLLYGGNNPNVNGEVHLLKSEGTAEWLVSSPQPITFAAEAGGSLYLVTGQETTRDSKFEMSSKAILRFPLGVEKENAPSLVFTTEALEGDESIQSIAADPGGRVIYFSTNRKVYAVNGLVVVKILDGLGGILRARGGALYVFNAHRRVLIALKPAGAN